LRQPEEQLGYKEQSIPSTYADILQEEVVSIGAGTSRERIEEMDRLQIMIHNMVS
jgi:hypothetical protein